MDKKGLDEKSRHVDAGSSSGIRRKIPRSQWLPALLLVYLLGMTIYFGRDLIRQGEIARLVTVFLLDLGIIALLYFFLKKRESKKE